MAGISVEEFTGKVKRICDETDMVVRAIVLTESQHQVKFRILLNNRTIIAAYYNDENGKTGFAQLRNNLRVFGADNANGFWHWHPREDPSQHQASDYEVTFEEFLKEIEKNLE